MPPSPDFHAQSPAEERERLYRSIFEAIRDGLILNDLETGRVVEANPAASAMHGYTHEAFIGLPPTALVNPDSQHLFIEADQAARSGSMFSARMVHLRQDGSPFHVEVRGAAFTYHGRPCRLSVVRDVSERVQAEQRLQEQVEAHEREQSAQAVFYERQRLAQELHDAVNQSLFSAGLIAEVLPRLWERDPTEGRRSLEDLRRLTVGALAELRLLLAELRPSALIDTELGDLLRLLGNTLAGRTNIPVRVTVSGQGALPADVQVALYRLCQEALHNIAKHAGASQVELDLQRGAGPAQGSSPSTRAEAHASDASGSVALSIRDDGRGFDPEQIQSGHYGLSIMRERAASVGAVLSVTSQPGRGTEIAVHWREAPERKAQ